MNLRFCFNLFLCALFFCFGFLVALWLTMAINGNGVFYSAKSFVSIILVVITANANVIFVGHLVVSVLRDIKNTLGL